MDLNLDSKTAVVTGASRGIGLAIVKGLVAEGVRVVGVARSITPELKDAGAIPVAADLSTAEGVSVAFDAAATELGGIDLLVNNVGGGDLKVQGFLDTDDEQWAHLIDVNLLSTVRATRVALPSLIERKGAIVNISTVAAHLPGLGPVAYASAKAAVTALGKALAEEFGPQGVRVNTVSPGFVRSSIYDSPENFGGKIASAFGMDIPTFIEQAPGALGITTGRFVEPAEIAAAVVFLLSGAAASVTGADYLVDGGMLKAV
ncbi:SDR family NAD(P)-dependent oxidoreductase [Streptomyces sp. NPDC059837]|uniref:SDR family NAD(P)-dependent oxidoreductase n=1 Tax=unclassified Streptomyces TaxID=2593676 RepID=UPI00224D3B2E|nr:MULTISPECIES: SDR family oxidoreductase [unclassified Streptomyces]MCX4409455.1 SDR family oxidoreductase [Streptomyces sp. NBC_01764]MCX5096900.1 SDR family oxidoreductase [Streptomyces sp. NBC_00365]MCX5191219.1 SDR family oxidoreductase [Streptomyces sp. NBC_00268]